MTTKASRDATPGGSFASLDCRWGEGANWSNKKGEKQWE